LKPFPAISFSWFATSGFCKLLPELPAGRLAKTTKTRF